MDKDSCPANFKSQDINHHFLTTLTLRDKENGKRDTNLTNKGRKIAKKEKTGGQEKSPFLNHFSPIFLFLRMVLKFLSLVKSGGFLFCFVFPYFLFFFSGPTYISATVSTSLASSISITISTDSFHVLTI